MTVMNGLAIEKVTRRLGVVVVKARRQAIAYSLLALLCTPVCVALASLAVSAVLFSIVRRSGYWTDTFMIYTGMIFFLGLMLALVLIDCRDSLMKIRFIKTWLTGTGIFLLLLVLTYRTSLPERTPRVFSILFAVGWLLVLWLIGQAPLANHVTTGLDAWKDVFARVMALCTFIATAYSELLSASWLWVPPQPQEVQVAARVLCRLAEDPNEPLSSSTVGDRVTVLLSRLELVKITQKELHLTLKGLDFVWTATKE